VHSAFLVYLAPHLTATVVEVIGSKRARTSTSFDLYSGLRSREYNMDDVESFFTFQHGANAFLMMMVVAVVLMTLFEEK
jgi:hypothetical protein